MSPMDRQAQPPPGTIFPRSTEYHSIVFLPGNPRLPYLHVIITSPRRKVGQGIRPKSDCQFQLVQGNLHQRGSGNNNAANSSVLFGTSRQRVFVFVNLSLAECISHCLQSVADGRLDCSRSMSRQSTSGQRSATRPEHTSTTAANLRMQESQQPSPENTLVSDLVTLWSFQIPAP